MTVRLVPFAPTTSRSLLIGTPLKVTGSLYQGVFVVQETLPRLSIIGMSNSALSPLLVLLIKPEMLSTTLPSGFANGAACARVAAPRPATAVAVFLPP